MVALPDRTTIAALATAARGGTTGGGEDAGFSFPGAASPVSAVVVPAGLSGRFGLAGAEAGAEDENTTGKINP